MIAFGEDGAALAAALGLPFEVVPGTDGDASMRGAAQAGWQALGGAGGAGTVLLAPIGTSFDQFRDYKARGASFKAAAQALAAAQEPTP